LNLEGAKLDLPSSLPSLNKATAFNANGKDYATGVSIDLSELTYYPNMPMPQFNNGQGSNIITITENNSRSTFEELDNNRKTIEYITTPENPTPNPLMRSIVLNKSKGKTRDATTSNIVGYIDVNIPPPNINSPTTNNGFYKFNNDWNALIQGSSEDHDLIIQVPNSTETLTVTQNGTYTPSQGNVGFRSVAVQVSEPSVESSKTVTITENTTTTITPSSNYNSIGQLEIITNIPSDVNNQNLQTITENGTYTPETGYSGFNSFTVNVPQPLIQQNKSITLTNNQTGIIIPPDNGFDAFDQITVNVDVPTNDTVINNQNVNNNNLITRNGFYAPDSQHTGFNAFTVAIPLQKDKNINVNGNLGQTIVFTPDAGYAGFEQTIIRVIPPSYQTKTITNNGTYTPDSDYDGFSSVTVNVPSSGIQASKVKLQDGTIVNFSSFININEGSFTTITGHHYIGIEDMDTYVNLYWYDAGGSYHPYETQWYYDFNNKTITGLSLVNNNNETVIGDLFLEELDQISLSKQLITGLPNGRL